MASVRDDRLTQEDITTYIPQENGMCERFIRTMKEEFAWQHTFDSLEDARSAMRSWIEWYNAGRPHSPPPAKTRPKPPLELEPS